MRRPRDFVPDRCYHLISRIANRAFYLGEDERTRFVARMWRVAYFSCVEVLAYCVMSNHFHILAYIPAPRDLSEEEVLARVRTLYVGEKLAEFEREWAALVRSGDVEWRRRFLSRFIRRMWNASEFMKTLKQSSSQSFNARRLHAGTMWESRFRARVIMPDAKSELMKAAGHIDTLEEGRAIAEYVAIDRLLAESDVIALHCPLLPDTENIIRRENIA